MLGQRELLNARHRKQSPFSVAVEIASGVVEIRGIARKAGSRSIIVVSGRDEATDPVGAVVGNRGSRIKPIVSELGGEKVDVVRWSDSIEKFIGNLFAPNKLVQIRYDEPNRQATITFALDVIDPSSTMRLKLGSDLVGWNLVLG
jgi:transcription termination/antitermination protein NusA